MANLVLDGTTWEAAIYQLERTDPVDAGTAGNGVSQLQQKQLGNRSEYLKTHVDAIELLQSRGPVYKGVITLGGDTTLVRATHMGQIIVGAAVEVTMPVTAALVEGDMFCLKAGPAAAIIVLPNASQTILDAFNWGGVANSLVVHSSAVIVLTWKAGDWQISSYSQVNLGTPIGSVMAIAMNVLPAGWLKCNGASLLRSSYARLFAALGVTYGAADGAHFNIPDLRGEFLRGFDDGRGVDAARVIGSAQSDLLKAHQHFVAAAAASSGALSASNYMGDHNPGTSDNFKPSLSGTATAATTGLSSSTGSTETRPRNIALLFCIKY